MGRLDNFAINIFYAGLIKFHPVCFFQCPNACIKCLTFSEYAKLKYFQIGSLLGKILPFFVNRVEIAKSISLQFHCSMIINLRW